MSFPREEGVCCSATSSQGISAPHHLDCATPHNSGKHALVVNSVGTPSLGHTETRVPLWTNPQTTPFNTIPLCPVLNTGKGAAIGDTTSEDVTHQSQ